MSVGGGHGLRIGKLFYYLDLSQLIDNQAAEKVKKTKNTII